MLIQQHTNRWLLIGLCCCQTRGAWIFHTSVRVCVDTKHVCLGRHYVLLKGNNIQKKTLRSPTLFYKIDASKMALHADVAFFWSGNQTKTFLLRPKLAVLCFSAANAEFVPPQSSGKRSSKTYKRLFSMPGWSREHWARRQQLLWDSKKKKKKRRHAML